MTPADQEAISAAQAAAGDFITKVQTFFLFPLVTLLLAIAFIVFLYGVFEYVRGAASDSDRTKGRLHMTYGIIGLLVMLSASAILAIARNTFGI